MSEESTYTPKDKKSYVMYKSWNPLFLNLPDEDAGKLLKAVCQYQNGENPALDNPMASAILSMMIDSFRTDNEKYAETCRKNSENGKRGGRGNRNYPKPTESDRLQSEAKKADMDIDNDIDIDTDMDSSVPVSVPSGEEEKKTEKLDPRMYYEDFLEYCQYQNIHPEDRQAKEYFTKMKAGLWMDRNGDYIENIGGHFREWLKHHGGEVNPRLTGADRRLTKFQAAVIGLFEDGTITEYRGTIKEFIAEARKMGLEVQKQGIIDGFSRESKEHNLYEKHRISLWPSQIRYSTKYICFKKMS